MPAGAVIDKTKGCKGMSEKNTLLDQWRAMAYNDQADKNKLQKLWIDYFQKENGLKLKTSSFFGCIMFLPRK